MVNFSKVLPCSCDRVISFLVKNGSVQHDAKFRQVVPWMNAQNGARYQDAKYGSGLRLHNIGSKGNKGRELTATCTVCGQTKGYN